MPFTRRQLLAGSAAALATGDYSKARQPCRALYEVKEPQVIVPVVAAFNRRLQIDTWLVCDYLYYLAVNGGAGEFSSFSVLERKWALQTYLRQGGALQAGLLS